MRGKNGSEIWEIKIKYTQHHKMNSKTVANLVQRETSKTTWWKISQIKRQFSRWFNENEGEEGKLIKYTIKKMLQSS